MQLLTEKDVAFTVAIEPENIPIKGNASAINPKTDAETEAWIEKELRRGNEWAWCTVFVTARYELANGSICASDSLGCCSFESEADFKQPGGYYEDMKAHALELLNNRLLSEGIGHG